MKIFIAAFLILFLTSSVTLADSSEIADGMGQKAIRGAVNLLTGIVELPAQTIKGFNNGFEPIDNEVGSKVVGTVFGFFRGIGHAVGRMGWGALELAGFWSASPQDNDGVGIPLDSEYAWEEGEQYSIFEPTLEEGIKPVGRKLGRGLINTFLGIAEIPGQTIKGIKHGHPFQGLGRGFWFWASREVYGFGDIFTCFAPNPEDNPGYTLHEEWPWEALADEVAY